MAEDVFTQEQRRMREQSGQPQPEGKAGAITQAARELNEGRTTYDGGARLADAHEERRMLILNLPADRFLDAEHLRDLVEEVSTWAPDIMRQKMLRKAGAGQLGGRVLRPDEYDAAVAEWRKAIGPR